MAFIRVTLSPLGEESGEKKYSFNLLRVSSKGL